MANQQLLDYIQASVKNGFSEGDIRKALVREGWNTKDIESAFSAIRGQQPAAASGGGNMLGKIIGTRNGKIALVLVLAGVSIMAAAVYVILAF